MAEASHIECRTATTRHCRLLKQSLDVDERSRVMYFVWLIKMRFQVLSRRESALPELDLALLSQSSEPQFSNKALMTLDLYELLSANEAFVL